MSGMTLREMSIRGALIGGAIAIVPAAITGLIATSKILLIQFLANAVLRLLTFNRVTIPIRGVSLIEVPTLWEISRISAIVGGIVVLISVVVGLANEGYRRYRNWKGPAQEGVAPTQGDQPIQQPISSPRASTPFNRSPSPEPEDGAADSSRGQSGGGTPLDDRLAKLRILDGECTVDDQELEADIRALRDGTIMFSQALNQKLQDWDREMNQAIDPKERARLAALIAIGRDFAAPSYGDAPLT